MKTLSIKVYTGLSLSSEDVLSKFPRARVSGPIERGDLAADIRAGTHIVAIVDGKFHQSLSVAAGEIMDALRSGTKVYGASSMGALRAAELAPYGMVGIGKIFEHIRDTPYFRDDLLGQAFSPDLSTVVAMPFVDLFFNVERLVDASRLDRRRANAIVDAYKKLHYLDRNAETLAHVLLKGWAPGDAIHGAARAAVTRMGSQKRRDGLALLKAIRLDLARVSRLNRRLAAAGPRRNLSSFAKRVP